MSSFVGLGVWELLALSVLGALGVVGMAATLGVRLRRLDGRRMWRGERVLAAASAAIWMAVMLVFFAVFPWWGRLVVGSLLVTYIWLTTMSQMWATVSAAYVLRRTAEADGAGQKVAGSNPVRGTTSEPPSPPATGACSCSSRHDNGATVCPWLRPVIMRLACSHGKDKPQRHHE